jgi:hypothetical protein
VATLSADDTYTGYTANLATSGLKTITFAITANYTGNASLGFGIGIEKSPYWMELNGTTGSFDTKGSGTSVAVKEGKTTYFTVDVSSLSLSYTAASSQYPGKFEFRAYYCGTDSDGAITVQSITANDTSAAISAGDDDDDKTPSSNAPSNNKKSGAWSFIDNGDGTATISSTLSKQIDDINQVLTAHYDNDYYEQNPDEVSDDAPTNAYQVHFSDFGIADYEGVTIESLTATISIPDDITCKTFMYGGGLNVEYGSPADTEYAKVQQGAKTSGGYWYNDMGESDVADLGVDFEIAPANGVTLEYPGNYFDAYWEVPAAVQPYVATLDNKDISFQFWYAEEDTEEWTELTECTLERLVLTYTKTVTVPYTGSSSTKVNKTLTKDSDSTNNLKISYADLGVTDEDYVEAVKFTITADSDIDKLVFSPATSVTADATQYDYWYQDTDYCVLNAGDSLEVMYIMPQYIRGDDIIKNAVDSEGDLFFGYWYGATDDITITNVQVYYSDYEQRTVITATIPPTTTSTTTTTTTTTTAKPTTTSTTTTTERTRVTKTTTTTTSTTTVATTTTVPVTTTTAPLEVTIWGDADCNGVVEVNDAVAVMSYCNNSQKYPLSEQGKLNSDVYSNGDGLNNSDALAIQKYCAQVLKSLPESYLTN